MATIDHICTEDDAGQRFDVVLSSHYPQFSRSTIQKALKKERILLNGKHVRNKTAVKEGDHCTGTVFGVEAVTLTPDSSLKIQVLFECKHYLVINKPVGVSVHPSDSERELTIAHWLLWYRPLVAGIGPDHLRPGIVHRLDKQTSGVMIVAKTPSAYEFFTHAFRKRTMKKRYLALVSGAPTDYEVTLENYLCRSQHDATRVTISDHKTDRYARTVYRVQEIFEHSARKFSLLELAPTTGRMHQLRVQLHAANLPIMGDAKYTRKDHPYPNFLPPAEHHLLHASTISFRYPDGTYNVFTAPVPDSFRFVVETCRSLHKGL